MRHPLWWVVLTAWVCASTPAPAGARASPDERTATAADEAGSERTACAGGGAVDAPLVPPVLIRPIPLTGFPASQDCAPIRAAVAPPPLCPNGSPPDRTGACALLPEW